MCFSANVSLFTFIIGTVFSLILIKYGNNKFKTENLASGIFLIFISLIQLMDFIFWTDLNNKMGINRITTILGPILNVGQPLILYLIKYLIYKPDIFSLVNYNLPVFILNMLYLVYFVSMYTNFLNSGELVTKTSNGHLSWPWIKFANPIFYLILFAINIFYLFNIKYGLVLFSIHYLFLMLSMKYFKYNTGELWCFFGSFIPLIMYFTSFKINDILS
jgi:hypothetical protein